MALENRTNQAQNLCMFRANVRVNIATNVTRSVKQGLGLTEGAWRSTNQKAEGRNQKGKHAEIHAQEAAPRFN
jgi:hypothetical protein